jgi:hypothetical protein
LFVSEEPCIILTTVALRERIERAKKEPQGDHAVGVRNSSDSEDELHFGMVRLVNA